MRSDPPELSGAFDQQDRYYEEWRAEAEAVRQRGDRPTPYLTGPMAPKLTLATLVEALGGTADALSPAMFYNG